MIKFNVLINPFTQKALVSARVNRVSCEVIIDYIIQDNWMLDFNHSFEMNGRIFVLSLSYEDELHVGVYTDSTDGIQGSYHTTFKMTHKDEF